MTISEHAWGVSSAADRVWAQVCALRPAEAGRRLFVVLQAYIDDSVDDDGTFVLAGYISTAERWAAFSKEWEAMLPRAVQREDGSYHFKMSEMAQSPERMSRVNGFHNIISRHVLMSMHVVFNKNDLERARNRIWLDSPIGTHFDIDWSDWESPFFMAYRMLMDAFHEVRFEGKFDLPVNDVVDFYFDETTEKGPVLRSWDEQLARLPEGRRALYGSTPRFENDRKFLPLQAADFLAWWVRRWAIEHGYRNPSKGEYPFLVAKNTRPHLSMSANLDELTARYVSIQQACHVHAIVRYSGPTEPIDPPSPLSRLVAWARRTLSGART